MKESAHDRNSINYKYNDQPKNYNLQDGQEPDHFKVNIFAFYKSKFSILVSSLICPCYLYELVINKILPSKENKPQGLKYSTIYTIFYLLLYLSCISLVYVLMYEPSLENQQKWFIFFAVLILVSLVHLFYFNLFLRRKAREKIKLNLNCDTAKRRDYCISCWFCYCSLCQLTYEFDVEFCGKHEKFDQAQV